jgi:hypothetical protein
LVSASASAQPQTERTGADDDRIGRFLDAAASQGKSDRAVGAVVHGVLALVLVPPGVLLATRSDAGLQVAGATLLVRGWLEALDLGFALLPSSAEWLRDHHAGRRAQGEAAATATEETEHEWRNVMENEHHKRGLLGALQVTVGGAEVAGGVVLMLENEAVLSRTRQEQTILGIVLTAVGLQGLSAGLWRLLRSSRLDELWALYESGSAATQPRDPRASFIVAPAPGGAMGTMMLVF